MTGTYRHQVECSICRGWKNPDTKRYYTPLREDRVKYFLEEKKVSHGYCQPCMIAQLELEGFTKSELEQMVSDVDNLKNDVTKE